MITLPNEKVSQLLKYLRKSKSQLRQDLLVLSELNFKNNGYFFEFGATNRINLSNTHLLEMSSAGLVFWPNPPDVGTRS